MANKTVRGEMSAVLVVGLGNPILTDDGIGPRLVEYLEKSGGFPDVEYRSEAVGGLEILERVQGYDSAVFIDAIKTEGGVPGTVYQFQPEDFQETLHLSNLHDVSFLSALELGKKMGLSVPKNIKIKYQIIFTNG